MDQLWMARDRNEFKNAVEKPLLARMIDPPEEQNSTNF